MDFNTFFCVGVLFTTIYGHFMNIHKNAKAVSLC